MSDHDVLVIGAGPAGMAAASLIAEAGHRCLLVDEQPTPGGQIYRNVGQVAAARPSLLAALGPEYGRGIDLRRRFEGSGADYLPGHRVWDLPDPGTAAVSDGGGQSRLLRAKRIILATGAQERPVPIPGWTLPGVMTAGALQTLLKSSALLPNGPFVLAGGGPLLLLLAVQLLRLGARPSAILMTEGWRDRLAALPHLRRPLVSVPALLKGWGWLSDLRAAAIPVHWGVHDLAAEGTDAVTAVSWRQGSRRQRVECGLLALHHGVVPAYHLAAAAGCDLRWRAAQQCWAPARDPWGRTTRPDLLLAGDAGGINGAVAAEHDGRLTALEALTALGALSPAERTRMGAPDRAAWNRERAVRPFLDRLARPPAAILAPVGATTLCRCEAIQAGEVEQLAIDGCMGPNQMKSFSRAGMGPCQGRLCASSVAAVIARARGQSAERTGLYTVRPPVKPVTLGEVAALEGLGGDSGAMSGLFDHES